MGIHDSEEEKITVHLQASILSPSICSTVRRHPA